MMRVEHDPDGVSTVTDDQRLRRCADAKLVDACRRGDDGAWNALVERFSRYVYAICIQGFRLSQQDAEDVFQDVFTKVYESLERLRDDDAFRPWLAQMTRRTCVDRLRSADRESPAHELEPGGIDDVLATLDDALAVREGLAKLPGACQEILDLFFAQDESYRTIGELLNLPAGTIASRISRCLEKLKAAMEEGASSARPAIR
jgi:RNA polymerase sigma factor (sigma-70 family)